MLPQEDAVEMLNDLIRTCNEGEQGYQSAAEDVQNSELETMFRGYAKQRGNFVRELQAEIERLGGKPAESDGLGAALHRGWMNVKSSLSGGDTGAIVAACESGEDSALAVYDRAARTNVTGKTRTLIDKQFQQVKETHTRLHRLKEEIQDGTRFPKNEQT